MLKVQLIETANAGQQDAILEFSHVGSRLLDDGRIQGWSILFEWQRLERNDPLRQVVEFHRDFRLLAPIIDDSPSWMARSNKRTRRATAKVVETSKVRGQSPSRSNCSKVAGWDEHSACFCGILWRVRRVWMRANGTSSKRDLEEKRDGYAIT